MLGPGGCSCESSRRCWGKPQGRRPVAAAGRGRHVSAIGAGAAATASSRAACGWATTVHLIRRDGRRVQCRCVLKLRRHTAIELARARALLFAVHSKLVKAAQAVVASDVSVVSIFPVIVTRHFVEADQLCWHHCRCCTCKNIILIIMMIDATNSMSCRAGCAEAANCTSSFGQQHRSCSSRRSEAPRSRPRCRRSATAPAAGAARS